MNQSPETIGPKEKAARNALSRYAIMTPNNLINLEIDFIYIRDRADSILKELQKNPPAAITQKPEPEDNPRRVVENCLRETREIIKNLEKTGQERLAMLKAIAEKRLAKPQESQGKKISAKEKVDKTIQSLRYIQEIIREKIHLEMQNNPSKTKYTKTTAEKALQAIENLRIIKAMLALSQKNRTQHLLKLRRMAKGRIAMAKQKTAAPQTQIQIQKKGKARKTYI